MTSFRSQNRLVMAKKEGKKNRSDELLPDPEQRIPKKIKKIKKHLYDFFSSQNRLEMAVNE